MKKDEIEKLALEWYKYNHRDSENVDCIVRYTSMYPTEPVVYFYNEITWEDLPDTMTISMVKELMNNKSIKKIKNSYYQKVERKTVEEANEIIKETLNEEILKNETENNKE